jgi:hypothetical protein
VREHDDLQAFGLKSSKACKLEYLDRRKTHTFSEAFEFFTGDYLSNRSLSGFAGHQSFE